MWSTTAISGLPSGPRSGLVGVEHVAGGDLEPVAARLEVVGDQVARDRDQPRAEVAALPGEAVDALERAQERVRGEVLGQRAAAHPEVDEPEHGVHVPVVEQPERGAVAGLGPLDERPDLGRGVVRRGPARPRLRLGRRSGGRNRGGRSGRTGGRGRRPRRGRHRKRGRRRQRMLHGDQLHRLLPRGGDQGLAGHEVGPAGWQRPALRAGARSTGTGVGAGLVPSGNLVLAYPRQVVRPGSDGARPERRSGQRRSGVRWAGQRGSG